MKRKITFRISPLTLRKVNKMREIHGYLHKPFEEWLKFLTRDLTINPTLGEQIEKNMRLGGMIDMWMANYSQNFPYIKWGDNIKLVIPDNVVVQTISDLAEPMPILEGEPTFLADDAPIDERHGVKCKYFPKSSAIVIGRGPDVFNKKHLEKLADAILHKEYTGLIVVPDGMLIECLTRGIIPHCVVTVDGSPIILKWYDHPLVKKYGNKLTAVFSITVNHKVYKFAKKQGIKIHWYEPMWDDPRQIDSLTKLQRLMTKSPKDPNGIPAVASGGNAGACSWVIASSVFKRSPVGLIGMDYGYPEGTNLEETPYFSSYMRGSGEDSGVLRTYEMVHHPFFGTNAYIDHVFKNYRRIFLSMQDGTLPWFKLYGGTINCTEGGTLWGRGITCMWFKTFLEEYGNYGAS